MEAAPASNAKPFKFRKKRYVLPDIAATELAKLQPQELLLKLKASNGRLPNQFAKVEFLRTVFFALFRRNGGSATADAAQSNKANKKVRKSWVTPADSSNLVAVERKVRCIRSGPYEWRECCIRHPSTDANPYRCCTSQRGQ